MTFPMIFALGDGCVRTLTLKPDLLKKLLTRNVGEVISADEY